ncbi:MULTISPECIES: hypothetical protein [Bacillaceae]|uniref:asparagine synthase (glutamine-hydrolyzing) n=1 Tax=Evansella alkalicola TaxID=745819 RepID=A0ABS6JWX7_9BACI|nr:MULTISPECIES: hypothetical protein [Bacillaceae]MBU9723088.1 hypothetical protein [Bacillus alkalicola]
MSDFIYSKKPISKGELTKKIEAIYSKEKPQIKEFHGEWGSLAVSQNLYNGFQVLETTEYICTVIGGPILHFQDNIFLTKDDMCTGTSSILNRWLSGDIRWDEDLSGPFNILIINKVTEEIICVTDLMSFIPVFIYQDDIGNSMLSTHVDALAKTSRQIDRIDIVSQIDFILHGVVTFPYTTYTNLRQLFPASEHKILSKLKNIQSSAYWLPSDNVRYKSINKAAQDLRQGLQNYTEAVVKDMPHIAQFISGGEDSRFLSAILPQDRIRDSFVFLDFMNREGKVAQKAAEAYGANFNIATRSKAHYIEILPKCTELVGSGFQYHHVHTFGFHKSCKLDEYPAVFGGLFSDALLKGARVKKVRGTSRFPFIPQIKKQNYTPDQTLKSNVFKKEVLSEIKIRRQTHLSYVKSLRGESAEEWFELWPSSMNMNIPNLYGNRRLFRSYEPFMSKDVVKVSASVPQSWKLNRRLFHKAAKPMLKPTKWLLHSNGHMPYFPWYVNSFIRFIMWSTQILGKKTGIIKGNQKSWGDWNFVMNSKEWQTAKKNYSKNVTTLETALVDKDVEKLFIDGNLSKSQLKNLMQVLYTLHSNRK